MPAPDTIVVISAHLEVDISHETNVTYITRQVIEWQLLTMTRPSEAAGAKWSEIQWLDDMRV